MKTLVVGVSCAVIAMLLVLAIVVRDIRRTLITPPPTPAPVGDLRVIPHDRYLLLGYSAHRVSCPPEIDGTPVPKTQDGNGPNVCLMSADLMVRDLTITVTPGPTVTP